MVFTKTAQKFGQWSDPKAGTIYGVGFPNEDDLNKVMNTYYIHLSFFTKKTLMFKYVDLCKSLCSQVMYRQSMLLISQLAPTFLVLKICCTTGFYEGLYITRNWINPIHQIPT